MNKIFYFSGTGNSLFIAQKLSASLPETKLIPIVSVLNKLRDNKSRKYLLHAKRIGFIFPSHGLTIPIPVKKFLEILEIKSDAYLFAIVTRGGTVFHGFKSINKILKRQKKALNAYFVCNMYMNDPKLKFFNVPSSIQIKNIENLVLSKISKITDIVVKNKGHQDDTNGSTFSTNKLINSVLEHLVIFAVHHIAPKVKKYFYTDNNCSGCGICEQVCLSGKITMTSSRNPSWNKKIGCYFCYACLNFCPKQSIQIFSKIYMKSYTSIKGRYPHPYARIIDMQKQKSN